ncbi:MAG: HNH endonuclease [Paludibacteraceae bacterium]
MIKEQVKGYRKKAWREKREEILHRDGYTCKWCGRRESETVKLHVHHLTYIRGCQPWDYPNELLETLCAGCHSGEHEKTMPKDGWIYDDEYDTEEYGSEQCELCGNDLRYVHTLHHPNWGMIMVGCDCANSLMIGSKADEQRKERMRRARKYKTFMESPMWQKRGNGYFYEKDKYKFIIWENEKGYRFCLEELGWTEYGNRYRKTEISEYCKTMREAKERAFNILQPIRQPNKPVELNDDYRYSLAIHESDRIRLLQNLCSSEIKRTMQLYLPAYNSIPAKTLLLNNIQITKPEDRAQTDLIAEIVGKDKQVYKFCVKFLLKGELNAEEIQHIKDAGVQHIMIDCKDMMTYEDISQAEIQDFMKEDNRYRWVHAPVYDNYLKR